MVDPVLLASLSDQYGVPALDFASVGFPMSNLDLVPLEIARRHVIVPFSVKDDTIFLAMADPGERRVIEELEFVSGKRVFAYVALREQLGHVIDMAYALRAGGQDMWTGGAAAVARVAAGPQAPIAAPPSVSAGAMAAPRTPASHTPSFADDLGDADLGTVDVPMGVQSGAPVGPTLDSVFAPLETVRGQTILVVDDEEDIRKLLRRVLEEKGYRVLEADRGSVALNLVKQYVPDAIVLDAMLPELHGFDICRRIKASARYGHIPILMISAVYRGWRFAEDLKNSYGVNAYIEKPFRIAEILRVVESLIAGAPKADDRDAESLSTEADGALQAGMAAYKAGDLETAVGHLMRGITLDPLSYRLHYHIALLLGRKGDVFQAIQELETAIDLNPKFFPALKNLAVLYQKAGFRHKAIEMWERAIGQSPDDETRGQIKEHLMSLL